MKLPNGSTLNLRAMLGSECITLVISDPTYPMWYVEAGDVTGSMAQSESDNTTRLTLSSCWGLSMVGQHNGIPRELAYMYLGGMQLAFVMDSDAYNMYFKVEKVDPPLLQGRAIPDHGTADRVTGGRIVVHRLR